MSIRGKVVLKGQLMYRRKGASSFKKRVVTAYCGTGVGANGKAAVAQLTLNEDYEKVEKPGQKPKNMILLEAANIDCSYTSGSNSTVYSSAGRLSASPSPSPHSSSQGGSGSGIITGSGSGSGTGTITSGTMHPFNIITKNGDTHEFLSESENDRLRWVKLLQLLLMFPFSTIPDEPTNKPIRESLRSQLDPKKYGADSVWPVYILPEEVGSRCSIIGVNVVALKRGKKDAIGHLDIYNPGDTTSPLISWDRDKMRRTGKTGNLVFIEIGRRCQGGPGLVWMYTGFNDAQALRETLHNFLFKGDGRAVAIPTQVAPIYDVPRSSFDSILPPSYKRHNSIPGYNNHVLSRSRSHDHDSGYPPSPAGSMNTPPQLDGPPVRLDKHPSIRRKSGTNPRDISRSNSTTSFGSLGERDSYAVSRSRDSPLDGDGSSDNSRSTSPQDEDEGVIGQMDPDQLPNSNAAAALFYDSVPRRTPDGGVVNGQQRVVLPGGGDPSHYEQMVHPRNSSIGMQGYDGYVFMKPAENGRATSAPIPVASRNGPVPADDTYHHLQRRPSPQNSSSPRNRNNYDQLPTIAERERLRTGSNDRSNYENHPLPRDLKGVSVDYRPSYENVEKAIQGRRGSMNQEAYENVDGERPTSQNSNTNNGNSSSSKRTLSLRHRSSERENVKVVSPMKNGGSDIEGYVVIQSKSESEDVNSTLPNVGYASIDYQSTDVIGTMRSQRQLHGQLHRSQVVSSEN